MKKILVFTIILLLSSCGPTMDEINASVDEKISKALTAIPTETTAPTITPVPTSTPEPTEIPTPVFARFNSQQAVESFKNSGLEAENTRPLTKDDLGLAPLLFSEGIRFYIPSLGEDKGGRIMSFNSENDLLLTKEYYDSLGRSSAMFFSWTFVNGNILVQINGALPENIAKNYESALGQLK